MNKLYMFLEFLSNFHLHKLECHLPVCEERNLTNIRIANTCYFSKVPLVVRKCVKFLFVFSLVLDTDRLQV